MSLGPRTERPTHLREARFGFQQVVIAHELIVVDSQSRTIKSKHTFHIKAARPARFFERVFEWTGSGLEKDPIVTSGVDERKHQHHRLHGPVLKNGMERHYLVDLGRTLEAGDEEVVCLEQTFIDVRGTFEPILSQTIRSGCDEIDLRVHLPSSLRFEVTVEERPKGVELASSIEPIEPDLNPTIGIPGYTTYRLLRRAPAKGMNYGICWKPV